MTIRTCNFRQTANRSSIKKLERKWGGTGERQQRNMERFLVENRIGKKLRNLKKL